jgi:hypothetical protein
VEATSVSTTTRLTKGRRAGKVEVGEECLVLLVGHERVVDRSEVLHRRDGPDPLAQASSSGHREVTGARSHASCRT